jgi:hypothetical protein
MNFKKTALAAVAALGLLTGTVGVVMAAPHGGHGGGGHGFSGGGRSFAGHSGFAGRGFGGGHHFGGRGFGGGAFVGGLALGALAAAPYGYGYYDEPYDYGYGAYSYGPDCYLVARIVVNRWGHRLVRHVRVCD